MCAKSVFFEGSAHVPLIIRPPFGSWEIHPYSGKKCDALVTLADILPTVLAIVGIEPPEGVEGINILELINKPDYNSVFFGNCENKYFAVIEGDYKYLWTSLGGDELLFNLKTDPKEQKNLVGCRKEAAVLNRMRKRLIEYLKKQKSPLVKDGCLIAKEAPIGPTDVPKWPGFHSLTVPTDVLH